MEHPLWTAGSFCGDGRPAGMGDVWVAEQGAYTGTLYQHQAEERQETARTKTAKRKIHSFLWTICSTAFMYVGK